MIQGGIFMKKDPGGGGLKYRARVKKSEKVGG